MSEEVETARSLFGMFISRYGGRWSIAYKERKEGRLCKREHVDRSGYTRKRSVARRPT